MGGGGGSGRADQVSGGLEGGVELIDVFASAAGEVGFPASFPSDEWGDGLDDFAGLHLCLVVWADGGDEGHGLAATGSEDDDAVEEWFEGVGDGHGERAIHVAEISDEDVVGGGGEQGSGVACGFALLGGLECFFERFLLLEQGVDFFLQVGRALGQHFGGEEFQ